MRERERVNATRSKLYHHPFHPHTHAHLDLDCMICFSMYSLFDFTTYEMQVCLFFYPALEPHKIPFVGKEKRQHCPGEGIYTLSDLRESFEELCVDFQISF